MDLIPERIEAYASDHSTVEPALLRALAKETYATMDFPQMQVGHLEGSFLRILVRLIKAKRILEIGTFTGYSALAMASALPEKGELITCDIDPHAADIAMQYWKRSPHGKKIRLELRPALETLESLQGSFDMVFMDADKENYSLYWDQVAPKIQPGGLIVVDNVLWGGNVLSPKEGSARAIHAFNEKILKDARFEIVLLTVRDGITLAWRR